MNSITNDASYLNEDVIKHIGSFLDGKNYLDFSSMNRCSRQQFTTNLKSSYERTFGKLNDDMPLDNQAILHLLTSTEEERNVEMKNHFSKGSTRFERLKWLLGLENEIDKKIINLCRDQVTLLNNTLPTSIMHVRNQSLAFWLLTHKIKQYREWKTSERNAQVEGRIRTIKVIFYVFLKVLLMIFYKPTRPLSLPEINTPVAKIGDFKIKRTNYHVFARKRISNDKCGNRVQVGILKEGEPYHDLNRDPFLFAPNFTMMIGRRSKPDIKTTEIPDHIVKENFYNLQPPAYNKRHLIVEHDELFFEPTVWFPNGDYSERVLDQKLIQIMIEIVRQTQDILSLEVFKGDHDYLMLHAGGFNTFQGENPRFGSHSYFKTKYLPYSFAGSESWEEIIQQEPILYPGAGVIPEYWSRKPQIIN